jgi:CubicO group peptidase (beta-lactamase class C family)
VQVVADRPEAERWSKLFDGRIARRHGMDHTYWQHLPDKGVSPEDTLNPLLQGGAATTAEDYMRFPTMLAGGGEYHGSRMETGGPSTSPWIYLPPSTKSDRACNTRWATGANVGMRMTGARWYPVPAPLTPIPG